MPRPSARPHLEAEFLHAREHPLHPFAHVFALDLALASRRRPQSDMKSRTVFADVEPRPGKEGLDALGQLRRPGQLSEQGQGLIGDEVLRIVQEQIFVLDPQSCGAPGILEEERSEIQLARGGPVCGQLKPFGKTGQWTAGRAHIHSGTRR